ncbi:DNA primase [Mycoplasma nasistruthionis]|uniref:DNA primase n=1 Tax=Mycoplasma nasistruthionis TaxID=353852 RepID=A0A4Y6I6R3_9MOLU|nr:DNA primase [Mycoplasma nasistruthionis]QDF64889.1 DNA primase [Mycoplasma nasistruthionis]
MAFKQIPREFIEQVKAQVNIVDVISEFVPLAKKGNNFIGSCPFHQDTSPSFTVSPSKKIYKCFPCSASGDAIKFIQDFKQISWIQALEFVANKLGLNFDFSSYKAQSHVEKYDQTTLETLELLEFVNSFYKISLLKEKNALNYLESRHLNDLDLREKFDIGYAPKNRLKQEINASENKENLAVNAGLLNSDLNEIFWGRITFGIRNSHGELVGFSARTIDKNSNFAKYLNSPETPLFNKSKILYNYHNAKDSIKAKKQVVIVEGFMDVIACYRAGINNVVALMGTALTKDHIQLLKNSEIILFLDNDNAGVDAALRSADLLALHDFTIKVVNNTFEKDADEILNQEGTKKLVDLIENQTISLIDFIYQVSLSKNNINLTETHLNDFEMLQNFEKSILNYTKNITLKQKQYLFNKIQTELNLQINELLTERKPINQGFNNQYPSFNNPSNIDYYNIFEDPFLEPVDPNFDFTVNDYFQTQPDYQFAKNKFEFLDHARMSLIIQLLSSNNLRQKIFDINEISSIFDGPIEIKKLADKAYSLSQDIEDPNQIYEIITSELPELLESEVQDIINQKLNKMIENQLENLEDIKQQERIIVSLKDYASEMENYLHNTEILPKREYSVPKFKQNKLGKLRELGKKTIELRKGD